MKLRCPSDSRHTVFHRLGTASYPAKFELDGTYIGRAWSEGNLVSWPEDRYRCSICLSTAIQVIESEEGT